MPVPYTFGTATSSIPLSQLDSNFATAITIGNTAVQLGNTVTTLNNMTLANVTISSGNVTVTNVSVTTANVSGTANVSTMVVIGNETIGGNSTVSGNTSVTGNVSANNATLTTSLTLSGGTANGVGYLNTSKVLTTGSAITFDGTNFATTGTASATKLIPTGGSATGNGMYLPASNQIAFSTNGTEAMRVDASQNVGIGTSSPGYKLTINTSAGTASFYTTDAATSDFMVTPGAASGVVRVGPVSGSMAFYSANSERMRIDSIGRVGIGVTPNAWTSTWKVLQTLNSSITDSSSSTYFSGNWYYDGAHKYVSAGTALIYEQSYSIGAHIWYGSASGSAGGSVTLLERMRIDSSGNVGIGTTTPSAKLQVAGDITMTGTAWTAYTPTITSGSGSFTTVSATGTYKVFGKTCWFTVAITITTVGTAGGYIGVSLPATQAGATLAAYGMEMNSTGYMTKGYIPASGVMQVTKYDNASIIGAGYLIRLTGTYETT